MSQGMLKTMSNIDYPIVVDLDGTLINTDLFHEGLILLLRKNPLFIFSCLIWLVKGRANLKDKIFNRVYIPPDLLPYNIDLLNWLKEEAGKGRKIVLATASPKSNALSIAKVHPIFDRVYGTEANVNLKGKRKLKLLINDFGESKFDYVGNSFADLKIFSSARHSYLVNPNWILRLRTIGSTDIKLTSTIRRGSVKDYIKAIRVYQWVKNLLIFVPLITSHSFYSPRLIMQAVLAFLAFSIVASAGYVVNDLLDLNADRSHPGKRHRPLASGRISISSATVLAIILLVGGFYFASLLDLFFSLILFVYFSLSLSYSVFLKRIVLYDVFILATLYSIRVFAGSIVTNYVLSFWLIAFSTFLFLSLAFMKRYSELMHMTDKKSLKHRGRGYVTDDVRLLETMGVVSGYLSVVVFALYIDSPDVARLYSKPKILWMTGMLFLFWISRIWMITARGKMTDDPIVFTMKDWISYVIFLLVGLCILISI